MIETKILLKNNRFIIVKQILNKKQLKIAILITKYNNKIHK